MTMNEIDIKSELTRETLDWERLLEIVCSPNTGQDECLFSCPVEVCNRVSRHEPETLGLQRALWRVNDCKTEDFACYFKFLEALPSYAYEVLWLGMTTLLGNTDTVRRNEYLKKIPRIEADGRWSGSICANLVVAILFEEVMRKREDVVDALKVLFESRDEIERPWIALAIVDHLIELLGGDLGTAQEDEVGRVRFHNQLISIKEELDAFLEPALDMVDVKLLAAYYGLDQLDNIDLKKCKNTGLLPNGSSHAARALIVSRICDIRIADADMRTLILYAILCDDRAQYWKNRDYHVVSLCVADMMMEFESPMSAFAFQFSEMQQLVYRAMHEYCPRDLYRLEERVGFLLEIAVALIDQLISKGKSDEADSVWGIAWTLCKKALFCFHIPRTPFHMIQVLYTYKVRDLAQGNDRVANELLKELPSVSLQNLEKQSVADVCQKTYRNNCK